MTDQSEPFVWSDAWLLLAVIMASRAGPADRAGVIDAGDYINRDIFTDAEFSGGVDRLRDRGYLIEEDGRYRAGPSVLEWYAKACPGRGSVWKALERIVSFLGVSTGG